MKIEKMIIMFALLPLLAGCGGGSTPTAPVINIPTFSTGGGTATAPVAPVTVNVPFTITVNSDITDPIEMLQVVVNFQPTYLRLTDEATLENSIDITGGIFNNLLAVSFYNESPSSGKLLISVSVAFSGP